MDNIIDHDILLSIFPNYVKMDDRTGYQGYIVEPDHIVEIMEKLRDEYSYDLLSSVTGVDYIAENKLEVVYHLFKSYGGCGLVLKVQVNRDEPIVPSLVHVFPGTELQEREVWDLYGIKFTGHPDLRRILLWEGFDGHPMRKDWQEAFFEEENKPFSNRFPEGKVYRIEDKNKYRDNVKYSDQLNIDEIIIDNDQSVYDALKSNHETLDSDLKTDRIIVNLGPQHPSTHGVFRMVVLIEGETILSIKPVLGYLHRNHEKIGERNTYLQNMPYTDRLDYVSSMMNNFGYAVTVEKLLGIVPPERAEYIRIMMAELTRIVSHLISIGFLLNDLGAFFTPSLYALKERELIIDIFEAISGSRMMCNYFRFGGVARDISDELLDKIKLLVFERLPRMIDEIDRYLTKNEIVRERCEGIGVLSAEKAIALSCTGPILRASGVPYDIRRADPYSIYDQFEFDVVTGQHGDVYDRYLVRLHEIYQSIRILKQVLNSIPEGSVMTGKATHQVRVPAGEAYGRVESAKGELGFYIVSDGKPNPYRYHIHSPCFVNLTSLSEMACGSKIADAVVILGSLDIVLGEVDR